MHTYSVDKGSLTLMPAPPGNQQLRPFAKFLKSQNISTVVSLLQADEAQSLGLGFEESILAEESIEFINFPIKDHSVPGFILPFKSLINRLCADLKQKKKIAIHCYAGIGRTGILAASVLIRKGYAVDFALLELSQVRGTRVPETLEQISWLHRYEDEF